ncbi:MAG: ABC transporter ATP-binding protein [Alphaproteobacteria bacterium]
MNDQAPLLETKGLFMRFGGVTAVDDVNFRLNPGELRCLIGPNGAGKSTFFKCLTGQLDPSEGEISFEGRPITGLNSHDIARRGIGIKTQVPNLFDGLTAHENVWLAARHHHAKAHADKLVTEVMARVGISHLADAVVAKLAHGQRQLIELATVLAGEPTLILLDEPAAGMTHEETARAAEIIREINQTTAMIVVEHDMQFIRQIASMVTVFHQGAILVEAPMEEILRNPTVRDVYLGKRTAA